MEGVEEEKRIVPKCNDKSIESFHLSHLRMEAVLETRGCFGIIHGSETRPEDNSDSTNTQERFDKKAKKTAESLITDLGNKPLKTVQKHYRVPTEIGEKLCTRYASKTTNNKLSLITEAFGKKKNEKESMMDHIAELETSFTKLDNISQPLNEPIQVAILLASIKSDSSYDAVVATFGTMDESKATWETVTTRFVDEYKEMLAGKESENVDESFDEKIRAAIMQGKYGTKKGIFCKKKGHTINECWKNSNSTG